MKKPEGVFLGQIFNLNRRTWHVLIVGKPGLTVNRSSGGCARRENTKKATAQIRPSEIRSRRGPARSAPAPLVGLPAAASAGGSAGRASYRESPLSGRKKPCTAARKTFC